MTMRVFVRKYVYAAVAHLALRRSKASISACGSYNSGRCMEPAAALPIAVGSAGPQRLILCGFWGACLEEYYCLLSLLWPNFIWTCYVYARLVLSVKYCKIKVNLSASVVYSCRECFCIFRQGKAQNKY